MTRTDIDDPTYKMTIYKGSFSYQNDNINVLHIGKQGSKELKTLQASILWIIKAY
ncbi:4889_t:CDS:1, partial [Cetraspora pellucida]